jgi:hypothetical protein
LVVVAAPLKLAAAVALVAAALAAAAEALRFKTFISNRLQAFYLIGFMLTYIIVSITLFCN